MCNLIGYRIYTYKTASIDIKVYIKTDGDEINSIVDFHIWKRTIFYFRSAIMNPKSGTYFGGNMASKYAVNLSH